jgi:hypothetical protein
VMVIVAVMVALMGACSGRLPGPASPGSCGDQCVSMSCPAGTSCVLSNNCAAHCEPDPFLSR